jgi:putative hemolysin
VLAHPQTLRDFSTLSWRTVMVFPEGLTETTVQGSMDTCVWMVAGQPGFTSKAVKK